MTLLEARKIFPKEFTIACNKIEVVINEEGSDFGEFNTIRNRITINLAIRDDDGTLVHLTDAQVKTTYFHELTHCFNFFFNTELDEAMAQSFAGFTCEYLETKIYY